MKKHNDNIIDKFDILVEKTKQPLFRLALNILKDEEMAMDVVQDTYVKAWENWTSFRGESDPKTWLYRITINLSINQLKKKQRVINFNKFTNENIKDDEKIHDFEPEDPNTIENI